MGVLGVFTCGISNALSASLTGKADVVDADTIKIGGIPLRLFGIDAPESRQTCERDGEPYACGTHATKALADLIDSGLVDCAILGKDDFGRALGICSVEGSEINAAMVTQGWALAAIKFSDKYVGAEKTAQLAKAGIWAGTFTKPWEWRAGQAELVGANQRCVIKGNVSRHGERIYHLPFQYFYGRTKIDESDGERWFCTEAEALEAGWRRSLR